MNGALSPKTNENLTLFENVISRLMEAGSIHYNLSNEISAKVCKISYPDDTSEKSEVGTPESQPSNVIDCLNSIASNLERNNRTLSATLSQLDRIV